MDRLPPEVIHMIFASFKHKPEAIALLRLVCTAFASVGLHYLLREVHLVFKSSSFEHLRQISEHPVLSKYIESLFYEADTLHHYESMKEWKEHIVVPGWMYTTPAYELYPPPPSASEREQRAYTRAMIKARAGPRYTHSEAQLKLAYEKYKGYLADQNTMRLYDYNKKMIENAMFKLPNLKTLDMSMECCLCEGKSDKAQHAFGEALASAYGDDGQKERCGIPQLRSLLLGAHHAELKLEHLRCGNIHWQFFKQGDEIFQMMAHAVRLLKTMTLHISTRIEEDVEDDDEPFYSQIPWCSEYLMKSKRLRYFTTAAPDLQSLSISFDWDNPMPPANLRDVVGDFEFRSLSFVALSQISADEDDLVAFYTRHTTTLKEIELDAIKLDNGSWPRLLQRMRKALSIEKATVAGQVTSEHPVVESYYLSLRPEINGGKKAAIGLAIEEYLVAGGDGPLLQLDDLVEELRGHYDSDWDSESVLSE